MTSLPTVLSPAFGVGVDVRSIERELSAQFKAAADEYLRVTLLFASTPQAPYAQYRLGEAYLKLGDQSSANAALASPSAERSAFNPNRASATG